MDSRSRPARAPKRAPATAAPTCMLGGARAGGWGVPGHKPASMEQSTRTAPSHRRRTRSTRGSRHDLPCTSAERLQENRTGTWRIGDDRYRTYATRLQLRRWSWPGCGWWQLVAPWSPASDCHGAGSTTASAASRSPCIHRRRAFSVGGSGQVPNSATVFHATQSCATLEHVHNVEHPREHVHNVWTCSLPGTYSVRALYSHVDLRTARSIRSQAELGRELELRSWESRRSSQCCIRSCSPACAGAATAGGYEYSYP